VAVTSFAIPEGAVGYWQERLESYGVSLNEPTERFDETVLVFLDPDGLQLELVTDVGGQMRTTWKGGPVPSSYAIRGFHGVTLWEGNCDPAVRLLQDTLGFHLIAEDGARSRFAADSDDPGALVDIVHRPYGEVGLVGAGTVHHVAWRTPDEATQLAWQQRIGDLGYRVTQVMDRRYFRSIYFREPGGVLFEIATDPPGFTRDEPVAQLGHHLKLPPWLEPRRAEIEEILPSLRWPEVQIS
jgi:glyoxalase family protein